LQSLLFGYEIGATGASVFFIEEHFGFEEWQTEMLVGLVNLVSVVGCVTTGRIAGHLGHFRVIRTPDSHHQSFLADGFGRRKTFIVASLFFLVGGVFVTFADGFGLLVVGRIFIGLGVGTAISVDPLYIAEISPMRFRGSLVVGHLFFGLFLACTTFHSAPGDFVGDINQCWNSTWVLSW